jgi:hypothetical protein
VFNATFSNKSVISWQSVLLVKETEVPRENQQPVASHWQTLSYNVVSTLVVIGIGSFKSKRTSITSNIMCDKHNVVQSHYARVPGKKFGNFLAQNLILPGTLAIYRIVNIWNDQQMSLISHFRSFNSSFQKCHLKIANREWKMFHGELSAAANKYWCVFSGRIIYTEKE